MWYIRHSHSHGSIDKYRQTIKWIFVLIFNQHIISFFGVTIQLHGIFTYPMGVCIHKRTLYCSILPQFTMQNVDYGLNHIIYQTLCNMH